MSAAALQFLIPGDVQSATGGYVYDRRVVAGLRALGWKVTVHPLHGSFPQPNAAALAHAADVLAGLPRDALVLVDGLALGPMAQLIEAQCQRLALVALIHLPLAAEIGLAPRVAARLQRGEQRALAHVRHVIVTSAITQRQLNARGVRLERCSIVEPGTDTAALARRRYHGRLRMLCVATVNEAKGHELLVEALAPLAHASWQLNCIGSLTRSAPTVRRLRAQLQRLGLQERVILAGEVGRDRLEQFFLASDLFVLPTRSESYCMAVAEALAHGLPVISTRTGAIPSLVGSEAGLLVEPGDGPALRRALARALADPALLPRLARGARAARARLPRWTAVSERMAAVLQRIHAERRGLSG
jgi:glycosyltransferase involved in cell wall biosynthesis